MANKKRVTATSRRAIPILISLAIIGLGLLYIFFKPKPSEVAQVTSGNSSGYRVGVDYNSTSPDFEKDSFILNYHKPEVRNKVKSQLKQMADSGASYVNTRLWFTDGPTRFLNSTWRLGFPPTQQELDNMKTYAQDVGATIRPNGQPLDLYYTLLWSGCADYISGHAEFCKYDWNTFREIAKGTISKFFQTMGGQKRGDGQNLVHTVYMDGEVEVTYKKNTDKWLREVYPHFIQLSQQHGINPSLYFLPRTLVSKINLVNNNSVNDTLKFLKDNNLYIPNRIDLSLYLQKIDHAYAPTLAIIINDLKAGYPDKSIGIAETGYPQNPQDRKLYGSTFVDSFNKTGQPVEVAFWTTPNSAPHFAFAAFPFDIAAYLPTSTPTPPPATSNAYFTDVPTTSPFYSSIESVRLAGIMNGCGTNPSRFCPSTAVTRAQTAYILLRSGKGASYSPTNPKTQKFADVPPSHSLYAWVDNFASLGITSGCAANKYCPDQPVTRAQIAVFLLRTKYGSAYKPPVTTSTFNDVASTHPFAAWINNLASLGITSGCADNKYCPDQPITRAELAAMLVKTFNLK